MQLLFDSTTVEHRRVSREPMESEKDVLIIDDDPPIRNLLCLLLTRHGLDCDTASHGLEGLDRIENTTYQVLLVDLMMPRLDGAGFLKKAVEIIPEERFPIVIMMTASDREAVEKVGSDLVHTFVRKPFDTDQLANIVTSCIDSRRNLQPPIASA